MALRTHLAMGATTQAVDMGTSMVLVLASGLLLA